MTSRVTSDGSRVVVTARSFGSGDADTVGLLEGSGLEVVRADPHHDLDSMRDALSDAAAWISGASPVTEAHLAAAPNLKVVSRYGTGFDAVDLAAAEKRGVAVTNTPGANVQAVADHAVGLMLAALRHLVAGDRAVKGGSWPMLRGRELGSLTVGVAGFGNIGRAVAARLIGGFGSRVIAFDPYVEPDLIRELSGDEPAPDLADLASRADLLSLHIPGGAGPVVDAALLEKTKPGAVLVNTARGDLLDEEAVAAALRGGRLAAFATDVLASEPASAGPLLDSPNTIITPHIAAQTTEAIDNMGLWSSQDVIRVLSGEQPRYPVAFPGKEVPS